MTPDQFKRWRKSNNMTQAMAAAALGMTVRHILRLEAGERKISYVISLACAAVAAGLSPWSKK